MTFGPLWFTVVPHEDRAFYHHLEVDPFTSDFVFYSVLGPFMRDDEELGRSGEEVDLFESQVVNLNPAIFQIQHYGAYPLGINEPPN